MFPVDFWSLHICRASSRKNLKNVLFPRKLRIRLFSDETIWALLNFQSKIGVKVWRSCKLRALLQLPSICPKGIAFVLYERSGCGDFVSKVYIIEKDGQEREGGSLRGSIRDEILQRLKPRGWWKSADIIHISHTSKPKACEYVWVVHEECPYVVNTKQYFF